MRSYSSGVASRASRLSRTLGTNWYRNLSDSGRRGSTWDEVSIQAYLVNTQPIRHSHFSEDAVHVVLHRLLGKMQEICNLFIAKPSANQWDELLFALRQSPPSVLLTVRQLRRLCRHVVEQNFCVMGWTYGMSFCNCAHRGYNIYG